MTKAASTILIVDDQPQNLKLLEAMLRPEGYVIFTAASGEEALAAVARQPPDLILLDVKMPGMDGFQVVRKLKASPDTSDIPVILVTALVERDDRLAGLQAGAEDFLAKPIDKVELWLRVRNLLRLKSLGDFFRSHSTRLEQQVQERSAQLHRFRAAMNTSADAIMLVSRASMRFVEVNATACLMFGYTVEQFSRLEPALLGAGTPAQLASAYDEIIAGDETNVLAETQLRRSDGSLFQAELRCHAHLSEGNSIVVSVVRDVTERHKTERKIRRLNRVYAVLSGINSAIVRIPDRAELFRETCRIAVSEGGFLLARVLELDAKGKASIAATTEEDSHAYQRLLDDYNNDPAHCQNLVALALRSGQPQISNDVASDLRILDRAMLAKDGSYALALLPFSVDHRVAGAIVLRAQLGNFDDIELQLLLELVGNLSFALEHIEKEAKVRRLTRVYAVLSGINTLIVRVRDRDELFKKACQIVVEDGKFDMAWIGAFDPATEEVTPVAWAGDNAEELTRAKSSSRADTERGTGAVGQSIRARRPIFNNNIQTQSFGGPRLKEVIRLGFHSHVTLPLYEGEAVAGTLTMYTRERDYFDDDEIRLLTELAGDISFAMANLSKQEKFDKMARIRGISSEINTAIVRIHDREALLRETFRIAVEHGKFELVWVALVDQEKQRIQPLAWQGFSAESANAWTWAQLATPGVTLAEVIQTRKVAVRNDIDPALPGGALRREATMRGFRSAVCLPFMIDDKVVAAMSLFALGRRFFDDEELALLNEVASNVSFALQAIDKQARLTFLAYYDELTGLANRTLFLDRIEQHMRSATAGGHKLAVFLFDLERFKNINDSLGQPAGDELLRQVAAWLTRYTGDATLVSRLGADHFAAVMPRVDPAGNLPGLLEKTVLSFLDHPFRLNDAVFRIAAKVGTAIYPDDAANADTLLKHAEAALKKAKADGDKFLFYTQTMTEKVAGRLALENQLRQALDNNEFVLHYQPKVNLSTGQLTGVEALIRWDDPRTGLVPPGHFIPILEETGLIYEVGRWALRQAIADYLRWRTAGLPAVRVAVNVSPLQLRNRGFVDEIRQVIGIDARAAAGLELEITESLIMEDVQRSIASLQAIRAMGVTMAIDDFGTGFSSLSYLSRLPVDTLKIDRSFVVDLTEKPEGPSLVPTIITLGHSLQLKVVAEGVETEEQARLLRLLKCDEMQGYLFSKPVPGDIFEQRFLALPAAA